MGNNLVPIIKYLYAMYMIYDFKLNKIKKDKQVTS